MAEQHRKYTKIPFPKVRQPIADALRQAKRMNTIYALFEVDVTDTRRHIREYRVKKGSPLSLTSFLTFCLAQAVAENKQIQAYRSGGKLIIYDDVDIAVAIEREFEGDKIPINPHVIKAANRKTLSEIQNEISNSKSEDLNKSPNKWLIRMYWYTPGFFRNLLWHTWLNSPYWRNRLTGTVGISSVGTFGKGAAWAIPVSTYTLSITVGDVSDKLTMLNGRVETREILNLTASFDHDIIDGAPAARFVQQYKELIENGTGLQ
jgi:pyruvate/2-oxoglutarate dehydrogenase complex dihydrolipoamide acyltransferase (E2) component